MFTLNDSLYKPVSYQKRFLESVSCWPVPDGHGLHNCHLLTSYLLNTAHTCIIHGHTSPIPGHTCAYLPHTWSTYLLIPGHTCLILVSHLNYCCPILWVIQAGQTCFVPNHTCSILLVPAHTWSYQITPAHTWSYLFNTYPIPGHTWSCLPHSWSYLVMPVPYLVNTTHTWSYLIVPVAYLPYTWSY